MPRPVEYAVVLLRTELSVLWFTLPMFGLGVFLMNAVSSVVLGLALTCGSVLLSFRLGRGKPRRTIRVPGKLTIDATRVALNGATIATRRSLRGGILATSADDLIVRLTRAFPLGSIAVEVRSEADGQAVLRALGFGTTQRTARFRLGSMAAIRKIPLSAALAFWGFAMIFVAERTLSAPGLPQPSDLRLLVAWVLALAAWLALYFTSTSFVVGADGIQVRWLWTRRFLGYAEIRGVGFDGLKLAKTGVIVELARGPALRFPVRAVLGAGYAEDEASSVVARVRDALTLFRGQARADEVRLPDRGERPIAEWLQALRSAGNEGAVDHRTAPIATESLWHLAEDPGAEKTARAAAAVALGARLDAAGKTRLRFAAEATAAPDLRGVLEASAEEADDEHLCRALARLKRG
ncbi:MAG: hypothetical protein ABJE95_35730 [Byssovorax sp.]